MKIKTNNYMEADIKSLFFYEVEQLISMLQRADTVNSLLFPRTLILLILMTWKSRFTRNIRIYRLTEESIGHREIYLR